MVLQIFLKADKHIYIHYLSMSKTWSNLKNDQICHVELKVITLREIINESCPAAILPTHMWK